MTNNINLNENLNKTFAPFTQNSGNKGYSSYIQNRNITSSQAQNDSYQKQEEPKTHKKHSKLKIALEASSAVLVLSLGAFSLSRSQAISKNIQSFSSLAEEKLSTIQNKFIHKAITTIASGFDRCARVITNISPIRDYSLHQAMGKTSLTKSLRGKIADLFTLQNKHAVKTDMKNARSSYNELIEVIESAIFESESAGGEHLIKNRVKFAELQSRLQRLRQNPEPGFLSGYSFESSCSTMQKDMKYLDSEMSLTRLFSKESLQGFVPEDILENRRLAFVRNIFDQKDAISCSFKDVEEYASSRFLHINSLIYSIKDTTTQNRLKNYSMDLKKCVKTYSKDSEDKSKRPEAEEKIKNIISGFKDEVSLLPEGIVKDKLSVHLDEFDSLFSEHKPGVVQELRILAGEAWGSGSKIDVAVKNAANRHVKDLNTTVSSMINMFDKQRDITLGSGVGDVLGMVLPVVGLGWELSRDDSTDKRVGTSLKLGIPIIGGTGVYFFTLARQFSGFRAMMMSLGSGAIMNLAGSAVFKKYMEFRKLQNQKNEGQNKIVG